MNGGELSSRWKCLIEFYSINLREPSYNQLYLMKNNIIFGIPLGLKIYLQSTYFYILSKDFNSYVPLASKKWYSSSITTSHLIASSDLKASSKILKSYTKAILIDINLVEVECGSSTVHRRFYLSSKISLRYAYVGCPFFELLGGWFEPSSC